MICGLVMSYCVVLHFVDTVVLFGFVFSVLNFYVVEMDTIILVVNYNSSNISNNIVSKYNLGLVI